MLIRRLHRDPRTRTGSVVVAAALATLSFAMPQAASVSVFHLGDIEYGEVVAGTSAQNIYSSSGAARFRIECSNFNATQKVNVTFTLPAEIAGSGDTVPITFGTADAAWNYADNVNNSTSFDPNTGVAIPRSGGSFAVYVWIGASITTTASTTPGMYSNLLTLNAEIQ